MCALLELFVGMLISLTNTYTGCSRPTLNLIECIDLDRSVPTAKPLHLITYVQNVDQNMNVYEYELEDVLHSLPYLILSYHSLYYSMRHK